MSAAEALVAGQSLPVRLWAYQKERFPIAAYLPMVVVFSASAALYSRTARGAEGFIPWDRFGVGALSALVCFAWLRILDEHKDAEVDRRFRPELPVPRGLVTLAELRQVGALLLLAVALLNALVAPILLLALAVVAGWAALMTREFFVPEWLRARPLAYLVSHMLIMPLIDLYTTGLDWMAEGLTPSSPLLLFLVLTFFNGVVVEIGRKIRVPEAERVGVDTYTRVWGLRTAPAVWLGVLATTAATAALALRAVAAGPGPLALLALSVLLVAAPAVAFLRRPAARHARRIESAAALWTILMYLLLGFGPVLSRLF